ncbi:lipopolysaccharide biosynthesis protein [Sphingomonas sp.]|uniref:lipopolysaccharide biosynthesis protein n=1 Tax=Sphingomonas sp. TaxID=28214 RepID=UPI0031E44108
MLAERDSAGARLRKIAHLLTGSFAGAAVGIPAIVLTARALGGEQYGVLAMIVSYVAFIKRFADFQIWQPVIRYGAALDPEADRPAYLALLKYGLAVDLAASLAGWVIGVSGAVAALLLFGLDGQAFAGMLVYASVLLFNISGMPIAVLRLGGRIHSLAYNQLAVSAVKLALCAAAFAAQAGLFVFLAIWAFTEILGVLLVLAPAWRDLRRRGLHRVDQGRLRDARALFPGIVGFSFSANISSSLWASIQQLDTLLVGYFVDTASAGLYFLAKRIARLAQQLAQHVQTVVYPDLARLWTSGDRRSFARVIVQTEAFLATFGVVAVLVTFAIGSEAIALLAGEPFRAAGAYLTVQMAAVTIILCGSVLRSSLLAAGRAGTVLVAATTATCVFYLTAVSLLPALGAVGANVAHIVASLAWLLIQLVMLLRLRAATGEGEMGLSGGVGAPG